MKKAILLFSICSLFLLQSCASPYIGRRVNMENYSRVCHCQSFPMNCERWDENLKISYKVSKIGQGRYIVEGLAKNVGSRTWENYSQARLTLYLVKDCEIVETISISAGQGSLGKGIPFKREFTTDHEFIAVMMGYGMNVRG